MRTISAFVLGLLGLGAALGLSVALSLFVGTWAGILAGVLLGISVIALYAKHSIWQGVITGIFAMTIAGLSAHFVTDYFRLARGPWVRDIPVSEAPRHPGAQGFEFRDGAPAPALAGYHTVRGNRGSTHRYVAAPLLASPWTRADPVPAWVCGGPPGHRDEWKRPLRSGVKVASYEAVGCEHAVEAAKRAHGLRGAPGAPILIWTTIRQALDQARTFAILLPSIVSGLYLCFMVAFFVLTRRRRR